MKPKFDFEVCKYRFVTFDVESDLTKRADTIGGLVKAPAVMEVRARQEVWIG